MAKTIRLEYKDKVYNLEYTRATAMKMEDAGLNLDNVEAKPMRTLTMLFQGAFLAHHRNVQPGVIEELLNAIPDKDGLFKRLAEMYTEPAEALFDEPEASEGNAKWDASW